MPPQVQEFRLDNGLKVLIQEVHTAPLACRSGAGTRVGSRDEGPGVTGVSHWVEHMNFEGHDHCRDQVKGIIRTVRRQLERATPAFPPDHLPQYATTEALYWTPSY